MCLSRYPVATKPARTGTRAHPSTHTEGVANGSGRGSFTSHSRVSYTTYTYRPWYALSCEVINGRVPGSRGEVGYGGCLYVGTSGEDPRKRCRRRGSRGRSSGVSSTGCGGAPGIPYRRTLRPRKGQETSVQTRDRIEALTFHDESSDTLHTQPRPSCVKVRQGLRSLVER